MIASSGSPRAADAGEHERDLREPQAKQAEIDEAEPEDEPGDWLPPGTLGGVFVRLWARNRHIGHVGI
jgi:hypothetical protein